MVCYTFFLKQKICRAANTKLNHPVYVLCITDSHAHEFYNSKYKLLLASFIVAHRRARLQFFRKHADWQIKDWTHALFTNDSRFCLSTNDPRRRIWRRPSERFIQCVIQ
jgi:hypothetical protein